MAKIKDPILFSEHFGLGESVLPENGLIDPFLNVDTQLFIDPVLLSTSRFEVISQHGYQHFKDHFTNYLRLLAISENEGDAAWKAAARLLDMTEPPQNGLGYGGSGRSGSSRPDQIRLAVMRTSKEIIDLGSKDPEMISLMGFFEPDVGPDTISDYTTRVIMEPLSNLTMQFCVAHGVPVSETDVSENHKLPIYNGDPLVLVPVDVVRELPIANDWSDVETAAMQNKIIRERVNKKLGSIASNTIADRKAALKSIALSSAEEFELLLEAVKDNSSFYDPNLDGLAYYKIRDLLRSDLISFKQDSTPNLSQGPESLLEIVFETIDQFRHHVENGNLWEELWLGDKPKKERAAQLIYFAIADVFCRANDLDISPEANMGGGPVDFKFSKGYNARVLVELKRSSGTVRHGYEKQLEIYKNASRTEYGIFVVMDYGDLGKKLQKIKDIRQSRLDKELEASEIIVIDATKKESASKRK